MTQTGQITNVRWFSRALTAAEVKELYMNQAEVHIDGVPTAAKINVGHPLAAGMVHAKLFNERT